MPYLLSYQYGTIGYGLSKDLDQAIEEAKERCAEMAQNATIVDRATYEVAAEIKWTPSGYTASKKD